MSLTYDDIKKNSEKPLNIIFKNGNTKLAFLDYCNEDLIEFYIYENGLFDKLSIRKEKLDNFIIELNKDLIRLSYSIEKNFLSDTLIRNNNFYVTKLLGYSETQDSYGDVLTRRMYFSSHGKYAELTFYSLSQQWADDYGFVSYKESYNVQDFDLHPKQTFYKYTPPKKEDKIIEIVPLTGVRMAANQEVMDCIDEEERRIIENDDFVKGLDLGGGILIFENEFFVSKLYVEYNNYTNCAYEKFLEDSFDINIKKENDTFIR